MIIYSILNTFLTLRQTTTSNEAQPYSISLRKQGSGDPSLNHSEVAFAESKLFISFATGAPLLLLFKTKTGLNRGKVMEPIGHRTEV